MPENGYNGIFYNDLYWFFTCLWEKNFNYKYVYTIMLIKLKKHMIHYPDDNLFESDSLWFHKWVL